ncbi:bis(5'-nucleosyl)-tetraphosphatase [asymmetrical]-like [Cimex lectularius]|uniref:Bis(5'-nucleosyl)-tetraphosphatase [asymmetrical] n=1 Tax=Cimex lectularius TaxID=79782 RepID=A0A8I6RRL5_CIMLE|nr:bis(5'-nucleosyl)-tetraphosphatase [asymmetrical]-like [Cimex lectularius]
MSSVVYHRGTSNGEGILLGLKEARGTSKKLFPRVTPQLKEKMALILAAGLVLARQQAGLWQFLLLQANYGVYHWSPPKADLNSGEQFLDGVYRTLNESTGFNRGDVQLFTNFQEKVTYKAFGNDKEVTYTLGKYTGTNGDNVLLHPGHQAFKWAPYNEARELVGYQNMKELLDKANAELLKHP